MAGKIYAVRKGHIPGLYYNWNDCSAQVTGFKGAEYKSFSSEEDAKKYLNIDSNVVHEADTNISEFDGLVAYVDGSYNQENNQYACGVILVSKDGSTTTISQKGKNGGEETMRNVAGEILGSRLAMEYCIKNNIKNIQIHHDYTGIAFWCTGEWKAKNKFTQEYKAYYDSVKDKINIQFIKVKGHSNNKYNDMADEAAKSEIFD